MNAIQKIGVIGSLPFVFVSWAFPGVTGDILASVGWTLIVLGYVAGNFWRYRHAMHFWWSTLAACVIHGFVLPFYIRLTNSMQFAKGNSGRGYLQLTFLLMIVETLTLQIVLKRIAMWIHRRTTTHPLSPKRAS